jgi:DNA-directed RNA polymerase specialized sigma24 family protein
VSATLTDSLLRAQSDSRLLALAREGHRRAFDALVARHLGPLLTAAGPMVGDDRATDIVDAAAVQAWSDVRSGAEVGEVAGWLHRVVRRTAWSASAGPHGDPLAAELASALDPLAIARRRDAFDALIARIGSLPEEKREALVSHVTERCSREAPGGSLALGAREVVAGRVRSTAHALATRLTPVAAVSWAARREPARPTGARLGRVLAGVGSRGLTGRAAAVVLVTGALTTGFVAHDQATSRPSPAADRVASPAASPTRAPAARSGTRGSAPVAVAARPARRFTRRDEGPGSVTPAGPRHPTGGGTVDAGYGSARAARPTGTRPPGELARGGPRGSGPPGTSDGVERGTTGASGLIGRGPSITPGSISPGAAGWGAPRPTHTSPAGPSSPSAPPSSAPADPSAPPPVDGQSAPVPVTEGAGGTPVVVR